MEKTELFKKIEEIVSSLGYFLIEVNIRGDQHLRIIEIYIDNDKGITADNCSEVSRAVNEVIEQQNLIDENFRLDVSSPGTDRPLKYLAQYSKHVNRKFEIEFNEGENKKTIIGKLVRIENNILFFEVKKEELKINFEDILKAKVQISF